MQKAKVNRKLVVWLLTTILLTPISLVEAQQTEKAHGIGYLSPLTPSSDSTRIAVFGKGLRDLGYVEGKNIAIEYRWAEGNFDRLPALAAELVRLKLDVIVTTGPGGTRSAKEATSTIPIVMAQDPDPIGTGLSPALRGLAETSLDCRLSPRK
jgi:putative ABC transport system substrate-binding protein